MPKKEVFVIMQWEKMMKGLEKNLLLWYREHPRLFKVAGIAICAYFVYLLGYHVGKAVCHFTLF